MQDCQRPWPIGPWATP